MKISVKKRHSERKSLAKQLRRAGEIPAVIYRRGQAGETVTLPSDAFTALMRQVLPGRLPTTIFSLVDDKGKEVRAVIKDIQYKVTNYQVIHLDFEELVEGQLVKVKVPIECVGVADSPAVKLGNVLRQVIRHIRVACLPKDIPAYFEVDVKDLGPRGAKRLKDLQIPHSVRPLANLEEVAVVMVKR